MAMSALTRRVSSPISRIIQSNYHSPSSRLTRYSTTILESFQTPQNQGPLVHYNSLVSQGLLQCDPHQEKIAMDLQNLFEDLRQYNMDMKDYHVKLCQWESRREQVRRELLMKEAESTKKEGSEAWLTRKRNQRAESGTGRLVSYLNREKKLDSLIGPRPLQPLAPKGLYLYGNVGCGKTMLMDMFYNSTNGVVKYRHRYHFHQAMLDVHDRMHKIWKRENSKKSLKSKFASWIASLPLEGIAKEWLAEQEKYEQELNFENIISSTADSFLNIEDTGNEGGATVLCFDEIQVIDVFAVVALSGIISRLLNKGIVLVATSNRALQDLNKDGMQKEIFSEFTKTLEKYCRTVSVGCEIDYRRVLANASSSKEHFFWPLESRATSNFEKSWQDITEKSGANIVSTEIPVMFGRMLIVPQCCNGVARFTFEELCARPVGAPDYIALAERYHTVFVSGIPRMSMRIRDKARRFITLIDELYNHHCQLFCTADSSIDDIFLGTEEGTLFDMESFQFETDIEGTKLRRDVLAPGDASPIAATRESKTSIQYIISGREEMFAFQRAVSRLIEMQTPLYLQGVELHPQFQNTPYLAY